MAECVYCKAETQLYSNGVPICVQCSEVRENRRKPPNPSLEIGSMLHEELIRTTKLNGEALKEFNEVMDQFPSGLPNPDGVERIKNASIKMNLARKEMA